MKYRFIILSTVLAVSALWAPTSEAYLRNAMQPYRTYVPPYMQSQEFTRGWPMWIGRMDQDRPGIILLTGREPYARSVGRRMPSKLIVTGGTKDWPSWIGKLHWIQ